MITMEMLGKVRRMYLRDMLSLHEISKRTGLSRNTLRKWVRVPEESVVPPRYQREQKPTKLSPYHAVLEQALKADAHRIKQNRRSAGALFAQITASGYTGSYSRVTDFIRDEIFLLSRSFEFSVSTYMKANVTALSGQQAHATSTTTLPRALRSCTTPWACCTSDSA